MEANPLVHLKGGKEGMCVLSTGGNFLIFRKFITENGNIPIPLFGIFAILLGSNTGTREGRGVGRLA